MLGFQFWRGEQRGALVIFEFVGDVEFLEQPGDALALADLEVVDCEVWCCHFEVVFGCSGL